MIDRTGQVWWSGETYLVVASRAHEAFGKTSVHTPVRLEDGERMSEFWERDDHPWHETFDLKRVL